MDHWTADMYMQFWSCFVKPHLPHMTRFSYQWSVCAPNVKTDDVTTYVWTFKMTLNKLAKLKALYTRIPLLRCSKGFVWNFRSLIPSSSPWKLPLLAITHLWLFLVVVTSCVNRWTVYGLPTWPLYRRITLSK